MRLEKDHPTFGKFMIRGSLPVQVEHPYTTTGTRSSIIVNKITGYTSRFEYYLKMELELSSDRSFLRVTTPGLSCDLDERGENDKLDVALWALEAIVKESGFRFRLDDSSIVKMPQGTEKVFVNLIQRGDIRNMRLKG